MRSKAIRTRLSDGSEPGSVAYRLRQRRWSQLMGAFPDLRDMNVLDLGGTTWFWASVSVRPASLTLLNLDGVGDPTADWAETVRGDACDPPEEIRSRSFDLVYSNSTIEHVGGHSRREQFAAVAHSLAPHMWIQTPYRYFPVEPHFVFPLFQHLPLASRLRAARLWPLTPPTFPDDRKSGLEEIMSIDLLSITQMRAYFPDSEIKTERVAGLVKSIIAIR